MAARIYRPAKTAMSSGRARIKEWILEYAPSQQRIIDPLMGWTGSGDMNTQVKIEFDSKEEAVNYARKNGIAYQLSEEIKRPVNIRPKGYSSNFSYDRKGSWTH